jgi:hypothetical protein
MKKRVEGKPELTISRILKVLENVEGSVAGRGSEIQPQKSYVKLGSG